jgi:hypothetical protein
MDTKLAGKKGGDKTKLSHPPSYYRDIRAIRTAKSKVVKAKNNERKTA